MLSRRFCGATPPPCKHGARRRHDGLEVWAGTIVRPQTAALAPSRSGAGGLGMQRRRRRRQRRTRSQSGGRPGAAWKNSLAGPKGATAAATYPLALPRGNGGCATALPERNGSAPLQPASPRRNGTAPTPRHALVATALLARLARPGGPAPRLETHRVAVDALVHLPQRGGHQRGGRPRPRAAQAPCAATRRTKPKPPLPSCASLHGQALLLRRRTAPRLRCTRPGCPGAGASCRGGWATTEAEVSSSRGAVPDGRG